MRRATPGDWLTLAVIVVIVWVAVMWGVCVALGAA